MSLVHFLLVYDLRARRLLSQQSFRSPEDAAAAYGQAERDHLSDTGIEIVLVGADSIETIKRTHGHYFGRRGRKPLLPEVAPV
jgi:hypothetical protein